MKQYCRYCCKSCSHDEDSFYCEEDQKHYPRAKAIRTNNCKKFCFNEIDVFSFDLTKTYKPRKKKDYEQTKLNFGKGEK